MRQFVRYFFLGITAVAAVAIIGRAVWVCSRTEGGWQILGDHIVAGTPPLFHAGDADRDPPPVQASRWLMAQADRVAADPKSTAADCMGAAIMLSSTFEFDWPDIPGVRQFGVVMWRKQLHSPAEWDFANYVDSRFHRRMLNLAAKATQLEPNCKDWWRIRAMLMNVNYSGALEFDAAALKAGADHDPGNALYEYLLAQDCVIRAGFSRVNSAKAILHSELLDESKLHYQKAMAMSGLATDAPKFASAAKFLSEASGPVSLKIVFRPVGLETCRFNLARSVRVADSDFEATFGPVQLDSPEDRRRQDLFDWFQDQHFETQWFKQWLAAGESSLLLEIFQLGGQPNQSADQLKLLSIHRQIAQQIEQELPASFSSAWSTAAVATSAAAWLLALLGLLSLFVSRLFRMPRQIEPKTLWMGWSILLWALAFAGTVIYFGFTVLESKNHGPSWWSAAIFWVPVVGVSGLILERGFRFVWRQSKLPRDNRSRIYMPIRWTLAIAGSAALVLLMQCVADWRFRVWFVDQIKDFPGNLISEQGLMASRNSEIDHRHTNEPSDLYYQVGISDELDRALLQWGVHFGLYWTTALWASMMLAIYCKRAAKINDQPEASPASSDRRHRLIACLKPLGKSSLQLAVVLLFVTLAAATQWIDCLRGQYEQKLARLADPYWMMKAVQTEMKSPSGKLPSAPQSSGSANPAADTDSAGQ